MNKQQFIEKLREKLSKLPQKEVEDRIAFYTEMIEDKIEDGLSEQDAIKEIGDVDKVASQIVSEIPLAKIVKEKVKPKRKLATWEIILIILGFPVWFSILASVFAGIFSAYVSLWSGIISLWAGVISLLAVAIYGIVAGGIMMLAGDTFANMIIFGMGVMSVGLAIFLYFGCKYLTKGLIVLTKKSILAIKNSFIRKEEK